MPRQQAPPLRLDELIPAGLNPHAQVFYPYSEGKAGRATGARVINTGRQAAPAGGDAERRRLLSEEFQPSAALTGLWYTLPSVGTWATLRFWPAIADEEAPEVLLEPDETPSEEHLVEDMDASGGCCNHST